MFVWKISKQGLSKKGPQKLKRESFKNTKGVFLNGGLPPKFFFKLAFPWGGFVLGFRKKPEKKKIGPFYNENGFFFWKSQKNWSLRKKGKPNWGDNFWSGKFLEKKIGP